MESMFMKPYYSARSLFATLALATALSAAPAGAAQTDLSPVPLGTASSTTVLPNLMFVLDDSGSMGWHFMPDNMNSSNTCKSYTYSSSGGSPTTTNCLLPVATNLVSPVADDVRHNPSYPSANDPAGRWSVGPPAQAVEFNTMFYNPQITYSPGVNANGSSMPSYGPPPGVGP